MWFTFSVVTCAYFIIIYYKTGKGLISYFVTVCKTAYGAVARLDVLLRLLFSCVEFLGSRLTKIEQKNYSTFLLYWQIINPLNAELNPICYLLALLGAHHFLHVSRIRVKLLFNLLALEFYI